MASKQGKSPTVRIIRKPTSEGYMDLAKAEEPSGATSPILEKTTCVFFMAASKQ